jgi:hypothetical protein
MRITWNENENRFEAQFSKGDQWRNEQQLASSAGFHTDGAPAWCWFTAKAAVLTKLKDKVAADKLPISLSVTRSALDAYNRLREAEEQVEELKKYAKEQKKLQKKAQERVRIEADGGDDSGYTSSHYHPVPAYWEGKQEITRADLPADVMARLDKREPIPQRRAEPIGKCRVCGDATYDPDEFDFCLWCSGRGEEQFLDELLS